MKKITLLTFALFAYQFLLSQNTTSVAYYNWSDTETFKLSPSPAINGYGFYSDSLSKVLDCKIFYEHNNKYYCIETWADYYYCFTQAYRHLFKDPQLYEYYYFANDDYGMTSYLVSNKYLGLYYPSNVTIFFDRELEYNRLETDEFIASDENEVNNLRRQLQEESKTNSSDESTINERPEAPEIFNKKRKYDIKEQDKMNNNNEAPEKTNQRQKKQPIKK